MAYSDFYTPTSVCNQALIACATTYQIGDINDGSEPAQFLLQNYTPCVEQLLRGAHWDFARREAELDLIADASGQTEDVGTTVPSGYIYAYAYPDDCAKLRFIPGNFWNESPPIPSDNIVPPDNDAPLMGGGTPAFPRPLVPTRFLITNDAEYASASSGNSTPGQAPTGRVLILSNQRDARGVYTLKAMYPNIWDPLFRRAMVAYLASQVVLVLQKDKKFAAQLQTNLITQAQGAITEARRVNGNESWASSDLGVDWMRARMSGGGYWWPSAGWGVGGPWGAAAGFMFGAYESVMFGNGSSY